MSRRRYDESREFGGRDPIDATVPTPPPLTVRYGFLLRTRAALGLAPVTAPAVLLVPLGVFLGPYGLNVVTTPLYVALDTAGSIALGALGVFVGLALDLRKRTDRQLLLAATGETVMTIALVSVATWVLLSRWALPLDVAAGAIALALGVAASASSASTVTGDDPRAQAATRIADLDDVLPIVIGGVLLAWLQAGSLGGTLWLALVTGLAGLGVALAGWLLFERARSSAERGVFVLGSVTLVGGCAAYLHLSPLLAGLVAGLVWTYSPGRADQIIRQDLQKVQHPLVVLLLLMAGMTVRPSAAALWLFAPFLLFRTTGKLAGGWVAARMSGGMAPHDLGPLLIPPGLLGVAFALLFYQVTGAPTGTAVLSAVVLGTLTSELVAMLTLPHEEPRA
jgi:hypothetical protein